MTREEAIKFGDRVSLLGPFEELREFCEIAVKALMEESLLGKIRTEIEGQRKEVSKKDSEDERLLNYYFGLNDGLKDARDIVDKYMAEIEVNDDECNL